MSTQAQARTKKSRRGGPSGVKRFKKHALKTYQDATPEQRPNLMKNARASIKRREDQIREKQANAVVTALGGHGVDPTSQQNQSKLGMENNLAIQGLSTVFEVVATMSDRTLPNVAMGMVLFAIRNGWMAAIKSGESPFYAFKYLCDILESARTGSVPAVQNAPRALWEFMAAIKPKAAPFKTAKVKYSWRTTQSGLGVVPEYQLGGASSEYYVFWGTMDVLTSYNGYKKLNAPAPYTVEAGAESFQGMCNYLQAKPMAKMSGDITGDCTLLNDTSAFTVVYPEIGESAFTEGGAAITLYSERHIDAPLLAKLATYQPGGAYYRGWTEAAKNAGTSCYILPRLLELTKPKSIFNKASPEIKFYNFDEFFYVLSAAVGLALTNYYSNAGNTAVASCPISAQDVQILLRQSILSVCSNHLAQDLQLGGEFSDLTPFVVGPNGVSINQSSMLLPTGLCECIRAMARRQPNISKMFKDYVADYIPLLTRPKQLPQLGNFATIINGSNYLIYKVEDPAEFPIDLIDCSLQDGAQKIYVALTGDQFEENLKEWNGWITSISSCLSPLVAVGAEAGISALSSVFFTVTQQDVEFATETIIIPTVNNTSMQKQNSRKELNADPDPRVKLTPIEGRRKIGKKKIVELKNKGSPLRSTLGATLPAPVVSSYLEHWSEKEIVFNQNCASPVFRYIRDMIIPVHLSGGQTGQASLQAWQAFVIEPFKVAKSEAGGLGGDFEGVFPTIQARLTRFAEYDTKSFATGNQQNDFIEGLLELGRMGRGGFFSQIAGALAGAIVPGAGNMVSGFVESLGG